MVPLTFQTFTFLQTLHRNSFQVEGSEPPIPNFEELGQMRVEEAGAHGEGGEKCQEMLEKDEGERKRPKEAEKRQGKSQKAMSVWRRIKENGKGWRKTQEAGERVYAGKERMRLEDSGGGRRDGGTEEVGERQGSPEKAVRGWRKTEEAGGSDRRLEKDGGDRRKLERDGGGRRRKNETGGGRKSPKRPEKDRGDRRTDEIVGHWRRP